MTTQPYLEALVETGILPGPIFHPGGLKISKELAEMCRVAQNSQVLDVACGTGETACFLAENFGCCVFGIDVTALQIERAQAKKAQRALPVGFQQADAHDLPFPDAVFDVVICEATLCHLEVEQALKEMVRVVKPGGRVGIHDLCWAMNTPDAVKYRFAEVENEHSETLAGWAGRFNRAGLVDIQTVDKSQRYPIWVKEHKRQLGLFAQLKIFVSIVGKWGLAGFGRIRESERIWQSEYMGYGIIIGSKPPAKDRFM